MLPDSLAVALKEWAVVVGALERGAQTFLLRKGGIADHRGVFTLEHPAFLLYPTGEHQQADRLDPAFHADLAPPPSEPHDDGSGTVVFTCAAIATDAVAVPGRAALDALAGEHIWSPAYLDQRWQYKPDRPLWLVVLRVFRLTRSREVPFERRYAGCRSWVPLSAPLALPPAEPALDDTSFARRRARILAALAPVRH